VSVKQPNILLIMADQVAGPALAFDPQSAARTPHLSALAEGGVVFDNAYCSSPLCAPSRFSFMAGQLPSRIGAYDNAAEFAASVPTLAHYLRAAGYRTILCGKMHFVGPDQLHGFEERLTTDIYPSDFGWTPDWTQPDERLSWYHNMLSVLQAGQCETSNQLDFDEEVAFHGTRKLLELVREADDRPFFLLVSFTHPHDPYAIPREYWDRYDHNEIPMPAVPPLPVDQLDPHSRRIRAMCAMDDYELTDVHTRNARHAYYGALSYVDDKVGQLLRALEAAHLRDDTIVIFASDHGDMLGERGLWYKMLFYEWSARVPLLFHAPGRFAPRRIQQPASLMDLLPTLLDLANSGLPAGHAVALADPIDGRSLLPVLAGQPADPLTTVAGEYLGEGAAAPVLMLRRGRYKFISSAPDPDLLFDLEADPLELVNLADKPAFDTVRAEFAAEVAARWQPAALRQAVLASQRRRRLAAQALRAGQHTPWDFQPRREASRQYMRNHLDLNELERRSRFPAPPSPAPRPPEARTPSGA
jgi:choline-sulfatase